MRFLRVLGAELFAKVQATQNLGQSVTVSAFIALGTVKGFGNHLS